MNKSDHLNDIQNCLSGERCSLGIPRTEVSAWKEKLLTTSDTPICIVSEWIIWDFVITEQDKQTYLDLGLMPCALFSQSLIWDEQERWPQGACVKTTVLVELKDSCIFQTKNTAYLLVGDGQRTKIKPSVYNSLHF